MDISFIVDLATIGSLIFAGLTLLFYFKQDKSKNKHDKCKDTLDAYNRLQSEAFDKLYTEYSKAKIADIVANYRKKEYIDEYRQLGLLLARIEHFCVGVEKDIYDWETLYELAHGFFDGTIRSRISTLVERKETFTQEDLYANLNKVWRRMDEETERRKKASKVNDVTKEA